jgi:hypothetical protein
MGKAKKAKLKKQLSGTPHRKSKPTHHNKGTKSKTKSKPEARHHQPSQKPALPFAPTDRILLIGEGKAVLSLASPLKTTPY